DVARVDQHHLEGGLEDVEDGLPVDAGRLHGDLGDAPAGQPVGQRQQLAGGGAEVEGLLEDLARVGDLQGAGDDELLVDVEAGTAGEQDIHGTISWVGIAGAGTDPGAWSRLLWVLPARAGATGSGPSESVDAGVGGQIRLRA